MSILSKGIIESSVQQEIELMFIQLIQQICMPGYNEYKIHKEVMGYSFQYEMAGRRLLQEVKFLSTH